MATSLTKLTLACFAVVGSATLAARGDEPQHADKYGDPLPPGAVARFGTIRLRHLGPVRNVVFGADGKTVFSHDAAGAVSEWDATTGKRLRTFRPGGKEVLCRLSPGGKLLATLTETDKHDDVITLYTVADGKACGKLTGNSLARWQYGSGTIAFNSDGTILAAASTNGVLRFWDTRKCEVVSKIEWKDHHFSYFSFAPDGRTVAGLDTNGRAKVAVWDAQTGEELGTIDYGEDRVEDLALAPDGHSVLVYHLGGKIDIWDVASGKKVRTLPEGDDSYSLLRNGYAPDKRRIVVCKHDAVGLLDPVSGEFTRVVTGTALATCVAFSPDGKTLALGCVDQRVRIFETATGREKCPFDGTSFSLDPVVLAPDGKTVAVADSHESVGLWSFPDGKFLRGLKVDNGRQALAFSPKGRLLATAGGDGAIRFWDPATGKETSKIEKAHPAPRRDDNKDVLALAFSPDGTILASGGSNRKVCLWEVATRNRLWELTGRGGWVSAVAFSPDGKIVAGGGADAASEKTCLWDVKTGELTAKWTAGPCGESLSFSPDGKLLATAGGMWGFSELDIVNTTTGESVAKEVRDRVSDDEGFFVVAFSPDGRTLALGSTRGFSLWETATRRKIRDYRGEWGACGGLAFTADSRTLITANSDGTLLVWDLTGRAERGKAEPLTAKQLERLWTDLAGKPRAAHDAARALANAPAEALPFLAERLKPVADLDANVLLTHHDDADRCAGWPPRRHERLDRLGHLAAILHTRHRLPAARLPGTQR